MPEMMTNALWNVAHMLAADMALNRVSKNLVRGASEYLLHYPEGTLVDYAQRLEALGDHFAAGESGKLERTDFRRALERVNQWPADPQATRLLLGWTARLMVFYEHQQEEAQRRSLLNFEALRPGRHLAGVVRECNKGTAWVQVASGQWGRARRQAEEVGDRVQIQVEQVQSPIKFRVKVVQVVRKVPRRPAQEPEVVASVVEDIPEPPASEDEVSAAAQDFFAFMQKKWSERGSAE